MRNIKIRKITCFVLLGSSLGLLSCFPLSPKVNNIYVPIEEYELQVDINADVLNSSINSTIGFTPCKHLLLYAGFGDGYEASAGYFAPISKKSAYNIRLGYTKFNHDYSISFIDYQDYSIDATKAYFQVSYGIQNQRIIHNAFSLRTSYFTGDIEFTSYLPGSEIEEDYRRNSFTDGMMTEFNYQITLGNWFVKPFLNTAFVLYWPLHDSEDFRYVPINLSFGLLFDINWKDFRTTH